MKGGMPHNLKWNNPMGMYSKLIVSAITVLLIHLNHYLNAGVDEGEIISKTQIAVDAALSLAGLYSVYKIRNKPITS